MRTRLSNAPTEYLSLGFPIVLGQGGRIALRIDKTSLGGCLVLHRSMIQINMTLTDGEEKNQRRHDSDAQSRVPNNNEPIELNVMRMVVLWNEYGTHKKTILQPLIHNIATSPHNVKRRRHLLEMKSSWPSGVISVVDEGHFIKMEGHSNPHTTQDKHSGDKG